MTRGRAAFVVVIASLAFACASPVARWARPADPLVVALGRLAVAAIVLSLASARDVATSVRALPPKKLGLIALAGLLLAGHFAFFLIGLDATSLAAAVSLVSLEPLSVVLAAWIFFRIHPSPRERLGLVLATAGALVVAQGAGAGEHRLSGDLVVLAAVALFGLYLAVARGLKEVPARAYAAMVYGVAAITLTIVALAEHRLDLAALAPRAWAAIAILGFVPTVLGHTLVQSASRSLSPTVVALVCPGETVGGIVIGALWLGQAPSIVEGIGAMLVVAAAIAAITGPVARRDAPDRAAES